MEYMSLWMKSRVANNWDEYESRRRHYSICGSQHGKLFCPRSENANVACCTFREMPLCCRDAASTSLYCPEGSAKRDFWNRSAEELLGSEFGEAAVSIRSEDEA